MENKIKKELKLAVIGGGLNSSIGSSHFAALNSINKWKIACGVFGKKKNNPSKFLDGTKLKLYSNIKDLIFFEKKNIDCFLLLTPPTENKKIINEIKKTNLPIISEKPIFNSFNDLKKIENFIRKNQIKFFTTYNYSFYPALKELKNLIIKNKKKFNKIIIEMPQQGFFLKNNKIKNWRKKDKIIPNLFLDLGSHIYNLTFYLTGMYPSKLLCKTNLKNNTVIDSNIWCEFKNKSEGIYWISKNAGGHENDLKIEILFDDKVYVWKHKSPDYIYLSKNNGEKIIINRSKKNLNYLNNSSYNLYKAGHPTGFLESFINLYKDLHPKILNKKYKAKEMDFDFTHSYKILNILNFMKVSSKHKKWVKINV